MRRLFDLLHGFKVKLSTKLSLAFTFIAILSVVLISFLANLFLEKQFTQYVMENHRQTSQNIVKQVKEEYVKSHSLRADVIENIGMSALDNGLILKVSDAKGQVVWDAEKHNNGLCKQMLSHMVNNMVSRYHVWKGKYVKDYYKMMNEGIKVGTVQISYYGPFYLDDTELKFINELNKLLVWGVIIGIIIAFLLGRVFASRISKPISNVIGTAKMIAQGNYEARITQKTSTLELKELINSINELAEGLKNQEILRKRLTGDVAHELRTPMSTLQSHVEAMIDGVWDPTPERLNSCHEEIIRINKMIGDIGKLAKYESENMMLNRSRFDLNELILNIIMNFEGEFKKKAIELVNPLEDKLYFEGDRDKLSQVLVNLISNALKYTPSGGRVTVNVNREEGFVVIKVKDNGQGIAEEDLPFIFERFYRADKSRNRLTGGAGIGLSIVKSIVEAHKGKIVVQSNLNQGSEFTVRIPEDNE